MPLKIVRESDPIEVTQLTACFHALPGIGKTSLGFTADDPILLDFDRGAYRSKNRRDCVSVTSWEEVCQISEADLRGYKTIVIDTAGRALDCLTLDIVKREPKLGRGGALSIQGFGVLRNEFIGWQRMMKSFGKDVVLLAHSDEQRKGDETVERLDVQGGSKNEIYKASDVMGRLSISDGKRVLNCNPSEISFGKNPANLPVLEIPDFSEEPNFLGKLLRDVKASINEQTEAQRQSAAFLEGWHQKLAEAITSEDFNAAREEIAEAECSEPVRQIVKRLIVEKAKERGVVWDKDSQQFVRKAG